MPKYPLTEETYDEMLSGRDLIMFKTTKKDLLDSLPIDFNQYEYFHNLMDSIENQILDTATESYTFLEVNNINQDYCMNEPLWALTKLQYFKTHKISEYYSPITFYIQDSNTIKFHPGIWRMAMLPYQENTLKMTMCIDTSMPNTHMLIDAYKTHELVWARTLNWKDFCKFMNFHKFPGPIYIQNAISGVNFSTDRSKNLEYIGKFHLAYNKNQRTFFYNHKPLVRWKSGFWQFCS